MSDIKIGQLVLEIKADMDQLKTDLDSVKNQSKSASSTLGNLFKLDLLSTGISLFNSFKNAVGDFVIEAGQIDTVTQSFKNLTAGVQGGSQGLLNALQEASKGTVNNLEMMKSANLAMNLMGQDVAKYLPEMMRIAAAAARTQGGEVQQMFADIIVASGRQSVMILDNLGISSATASQEMDRFAKSINKTREQLTDAEKKQAFFNAVMVAGRDLMKNVGNEGLTLGESLQVIKANSENFTQSIESNMLPGLKLLMNDFADASGKTRSFGDAIGEVVGRSLASASASLNFIISRLKMLQHAYYAIKAELTGNIADEKKAAQYKAEILEFEKKSMKGYLMAYASNWDEIKNKNQDVTKNIRKNAAETVADKPKYLSFWQSLSEGTRAYVDGTMKAFQTLSGGLTNIIQKYGEFKLANLDKAQKKEMNQLESVQAAERDALVKSEMTEKEKTAKLMELDKKHNTNKLALEKKLQKDKSKLQTEQAKKQRVADIIQSIVNTALAVVSALQLVPSFLGITMAGIVGAMGAAQTALIAAQPLPTFATGGVADTPSIFGEQGKELAFPLEGPEGKTALSQLANAFYDMFAEKKDRGGSIINAGNITSGNGGNIYLDGSLVGKWLTDGSNNGIFTINKRVVVT